MPREREIPREAAKSPQRAGARIGRLRGILDHDSKVREWYDERALRSRLSADTYARQLSAISERLGLATEEMVMLASEDPARLRTLLTRCASAMKREGLLDSYVSKWFESLKSYLRYRRVQADVFPRLSAAKGESLANERVPAPEELGKVLERLSVRGRVIALLMAHSGLRPGAIGGYGGENGIQLEDIPELKLIPIAEFKVTPFVIRVPAALSKTRVAYTTFGSSHLASTLVTYLDQRREGGEKLTPSSPVVVAAGIRGAARRSREAASHGEGFLTTKAIVEEIREALKATTPEGVSWRPYVLRAYCSTRLMLAEGAGKITRDLREEILGHDGGVAARYNVGKRWGDELLNEARAAYKRCEPFLSTLRADAERDDEIERIRRVMLSIAGYSQAELAKMNVGALSWDELAKRVEDRVGSKGEAHPSQQVVPLERVEGLLSAGWEYVAALGQDRAILRVPNGFGAPLHARGLVDEFTGMH